MAKYVDGFVIPLKKKNLAAYKKMATAGRKAWMKYGALDYYECVGDELESPWGLPFSKLLKLKKDETAIFAFIVYKSKADRNRINKLVQADPALNDPKLIAKMPFDMRTMTTGMFKVIVST
jgi:uncharacterized protein YbaA (DUF1428 family)